MIDNFALKLAQDKQKMYQSFTLADIVLCLDFEFGIKATVDEVYEVLSKYGMYRVHGDMNCEYYALKDGI